MEQIDYDFIKKRRIEKNLSLQELASELGFKDASTYYKYETGAYAIKAHMLPKLAQILDCDIANFFTT